MATVLVVDDRATNREIARVTLEHGGHRVVEAIDGDEALSAAAAAHPDVIIADVLMPGMDGYDFVHALRGAPATADIPVLFYTANFRPEEAEPLAEAYGVTRVLSKSAAPLELLDAVEHALRTRVEPVADASEPDGTGQDLSSQHLQTINAKLLEKLQELDQTEARLSTIAELSPIGIAVGDPDGNATYVNRSLCEIAQVQPDELLGTGWLRCLPPDERAEALAGPPQDELRCYGEILLGEGRLRWLSSVVRTIRDSEFRPTGFVAMVDDVTPLIEAEQRRHAEQRDREAQERLRITERYDSLARLSGGVAHDFNNLLNIIQSFNEFAHDSVAEAVGAPLTEAIAEGIFDDLRHIEQASKRAAHLTHQLLTFGGREVAQPTVIDINEVVAQVRAGLGEQTAGTDGQIELVTQLDRAVRPVRADHRRLAQVLRNLAVNACEALADAGGHLALRTANVSEAATLPPGLPAGAYVRIDVADDGPGMPPEVVERAMEPFFTTKPTKHGTGLGLATAYGVVRQAGGELVIDSAVGRGTTVHVYLPATEERAEGSRPIPQASAPVEATILVAEDEEGVREVVARILSRAGYRVLAARDGEEGLTLAREHDGTIDAVLTDVVMPRMNGAQLAEGLNRLRPRTPILFMSGYAGPLMGEQGLLPAGVTVLGKPFTKAELLDAVRATLAAAGPPAPASAGPGPQLPDRADTPPYPDGARGAGMDVGVGHN